MTTYIRECGDGMLVEYRRHPHDPVILHLEHRLLRRDGTPHDERWYPVRDAHLLGLQLSGSDIVDLLAGQGARR